MRQRTNLFRPKIWDEEAQTDPPVRGASELVAELAKNRVRETEGQVIDKADMQDQLRGFCGLCKCRRRMGLRPEKPACRRLPQIAQTPFDLAKAICTLAMRVLGPRGVRRVQPQEAHRLRLKCAMFASALQQLRKLWQCFRGQEFETKGGGRESELIGVFLEKWPPKEAANRTLPWCD